MEGPLKTKFFVEGLPSLKNLKIKRNELKLYVMNFEKKMKFPL